MTNVNEGPPGELVKAHWIPGLLPLGRLLRKGYSGGGEGGRTPLVTPEWWVVVGLCPLQTFA